MDPFADPLPSRPNERRQRAFFTQADVEAEIFRLSTVLGEKYDEHAQAAERAARADAAYKNAHAAALLRADAKSADLREAIAHRQVEGEYLERKIAESLEDHLKEATRGIRAQLSALQTVAANQRALVS